MRRRRAARLRLLRLPATAATPTAALLLLIVLLLAASSPLTLPTGVVVRAFSPPGRPVAAYRGAVVAAGPHAAQWGVLDGASAAAAAAAAAARTSPSSSSPSSSTALTAIVDPTIASTLAESASSTTTALATAFVPTTDDIKTAFNVATFLPQPFWLFLILAPNAGITKKMFGRLEVVTLFCLVHFFIVTASILQPDGTAPMAEFNDVFDPSGDPQAAMLGMMRYPNFVSEEWSHVLTWDLFVGRWIWLDGLRRGVFTSHSVILCNLIGPPGLLLHWATCLVTGKGLSPSEVPEEDGEGRG